MHIRSACLLFSLSITTLFCSFSSKSQSASPDSVTLMFAGDVTLADFFEREVGDSLSYPFARMKWFGDADLTMVNLENPMTLRGTRVEKEYNFRANPKYARLLHGSGIDLVTLANNHILDYGSEGVFDTIANLDSAEVRHVGAGLNLDAARKPVIVDINGLRIGFLGYLDSIRTRTLQFAGDSTAGPAGFTMDSLLQDIARLRDQADYIVINYHWGVEKSHETQQRQIDIAHRAIDAGADLIVGHHPHVLQGIERYKGKVIAYSLGNFIFGGNSHHSYATAVLRISIPVRSPSAYRARIIPVYVERWQPYALKGSGARRILRQVEDYSEIFPDNIFSVDTTK